MKKNVILVLILLFTSSFNIININAEPKEVTYVVVYDEAHLQFFTHELMNTALSSLNDTFDTESKNVTIDLIINEEAFTKAKLQGANLVIVPSPNLNEKKDTNAVQGESLALGSFLTNGGSVFFMANPFTNNDSIAPHNDALQRIVPQEMGDSVLLGKIENIDSDNGTLLIDDDNNDGNNSHVYFDQRNLQYDPWKSEINNISRVVYYGSVIEEGPGGVIYGNGSKYTYAIDNNYVIKNPRADGHKWIAGRSVGQNGGRGLMIGSTIMFSDLAYDNSSSWAEAEDNLELFQNLIAWSLKITPLNLPQETIANDFEYFLTRNILFGILLPLLLLALVFGLMLRSKSITLDRIFEFRVKRKKTTKKAGKASKKTAKKPAKKGTTKKTRRKRS